jgi:hypothetical protein
MLHDRFTFGAFAIALAIFAVIMAFIELGRWIGVRQNRRLRPEARGTATPGASVVFALLSLLIGFSFNGAAGRFDNRRNLMSHTVNVTGTAWQRIDALPLENQDSIRTLFRRYLDAVIAPYADEPSSIAQGLAMPAAVASAQDALWTRAAADCLVPAGERARMLLLPSLNDMFGAVDEERLARRIHPPLMIWVMLAIAEIAGAIFLGYGMAAAPTRSWVHVIGVSATIALATYVIIELEYPRLGVVRIDAMDRALAELRATMR